MSNVINVLLVDDHIVMREALALMLGQVEGINVLGGLSTGEEALNLFSAYNPDVILMDIMMRGMTGLEATRWIKEQNGNVKIIIISSEVKKEFVSMGLKFGIDGYLPKDVDKETLIEAIRTVAKGEKYFTSAITNLVFEAFYLAQKEDPKKSHKDVAGLTDRESQILEQVANGRSNQKIAEACFISVKTVETHKANILKKLGLKNTAELVKYAIKNNIISMD